MPQNIRDVMTARPVTVDPSTTIVDVAKQMDRDDIGEVLVAESDRLRGLVTDRDIVVRAIAEGRDPATTRVEDICSHEVVSLSPDDSIDDAAHLMGDKAIRRLAVLENGRPIGVVSLGDIAAVRDPASALGQISTAPADE